jgi:hypothetical protein
MTKPRDPDALLDAYLADGMEVLPDRVVDAVLDEVHRTHQRTLFGPWRTRSMFKTALGAAAVFAVLVFGGSLFLFQRGRPAVVGGPSQTPAIARPTPGANASPSTAPTPTVVAARAPSWTPTGDVSGPRWGGTAVLLEDGKVLVFGGNSGPWPPDAELYDPGTGTWTATGPMITPRMQFAATRLLDGRVLVVGGQGDNGALASAELYDPSAGTWAAAGTLHTAREYGTTATLLPDGRVLIAGGSSQNAPMASSEMYDPRTGSWTRTGSMGTKRAGATATLLANGKVLVAGGGGLVPGETFGWATLASAELYDPASGIWTATGTMTVPRVDQTAVLLPDGRALVLGRIDAGAAGAGTAEVYDPGSGTWTATAPPSSLKDGFSATVLRDGRVLVAGGVPRPRGVGNTLVVCDPASASAQLYDPRTGTWIAASDMIQGRYGHTATLLPDGNVLVAGGATSWMGEPCPSGGDLLSSAELYDPGTGQ